MLGLQLLWPDSHRLMVVRGKHCPITLLESMFQKCNTNIILLYFHIPFQNFDLRTVLHFVDG